jgi:hypothetical protein
VSLVANRLEDILTGDIGLDENSAKQVVVEISSWVEDKDRSEIKDIRVSDKLIQVKLENDKLEFWSVDVTNVAGVSLIAPNAKSRFFVLSINDI